MLPPLLSLTHCGPSMALHSIEQPSLFGLLSSCTRWNYVREAGLTIPLLSCEIEKSASRVGRSCGLLASSCWPEQEQAQVDHIIGVELHLGGITVDSKKRGLLSFPDPVLSFSSLRLSSYQVLCGVSLNTVACAVRCLIPASRKANRVTANSGIGVLGSSLISRARYSPQKDACVIPWEPKPTAQNRPSSK